MKNGDVDWATFASDAYLEHNYARLRADDAIIVQQLAAFYDALPAGLDVLEVGTGPNMYPVLAAVAVARRIDVVEYAPTNVAWLEREVQDLSGRWQPFWAALQAGSERYAGIDPAEAVRRLTHVAQGSIFDLPTSRWDVVSMHFVAESLTGDETEFERAVDCFLGAARPGGRFIAALMEGSRGYAVGDASFPAVAVDEARVRRALHGATDLQVTRIGLQADQTALRAGYSGMLVVSGTRS